MALDRLTKVDGGGISTTSDYRVGIITASKFIGPLDGIGGNFSGVVTATNGVFSGNISAVDGNFSGNVTIGGTLTYEDVTNIDSVGIITARDGIDCNADLDVDGHTNLDNTNIVGMVTVTTSGDYQGPLINGNICPTVRFATNNNTTPLYKVGLSGNVADTFAISDGATSNDRLTVTATKTTINGYLHTGNVQLDHKIYHTNDTNNSIEFGTDLQHFYTNGSERLKIQNSGIIITGVTSFTASAHVSNANGSVFFGAGNATAYGSQGGIGRASNANYHIGSSAPGDLCIAAEGSKRILFGTKTGTGIGGITKRMSIASNGNVSIDNDLDVDGHTNLDNVSIAGVSTHSEGIFLPDVKKITLGNSNDIEIYHDTLHYIKGNNSRSMLIQNDNANIHLQPKTGENALKALPDGAVELYFNNGKRFETTGGGAQVSGTFAELIFNASNGAGNQYKFRASGTNSKGFELLDVTLNQRAYLYHNSTYLGGVHHFHTNGTLQLAIEQGHIRVKNDNSRLQIGASQDLQIYHDGSHSYIDNNTGSLRFRDAGGAEKFRISGTGTQFNDDITLSNDNDKINIGAGNDLKIYHSTFNYIESHNDSEIHINANTGGSVENMAKFKPNGAVELYHNGTKRIETTSIGANVTGRFQVEGDAYFLGSTSGRNIVFDRSDHALEFADDAKATFGDSQDLKIFHDTSATNNVIEGHTGSLNLRNYNTNSTDIVLSARNNILLQTNLNETAIQCLANGSVELFHDSGTYGTAKLQTKTSGIKVNGKLGINESAPYAELDIASSVEDSDTGILSEHGIRLSHIGATDEEVIPITAGFKSAQDRARAGIGFISKTISGSAGSGGAIGFYTRNSADGTALRRADERMRVHENGRVTIGDSDASAAGTYGLFHLYEASNDPYMIIQNGGAGDAPLDLGGIIFRNNTNAQAQIKAYQSDIDNGNIHFYTNYGGSFADRAVMTDIGTLKLQSGNTEEKISLQGSGNPLIRFKESSTDKAYIQWNGSGFLGLYNQGDASSLRIKDGIDFSKDGTTYHNVHHAGNSSDWGETYTNYFVGTSGASTSVRDTEKTRFYKVSIDTVRNYAGGNDVRIMRAGVHTDNGTHGMWVGSMDVQIKFRPSNCGNGANYSRVVHNYHSNTSSVTQGQGGGNIAKIRDYLACQESARLYVWLRGQLSYQITVNGRPANIYAIDMNDYVTSIDSTIPPSGFDGEGRDAYSIMFGHQGQTGAGRKLYGNAGGVEAQGNVSATGSKPFKIPHPLDELSTTKNLVHAAIEGPQCDNIYRGKTTLVAGISTVNIDTNAGMTEGTFATLNRDIQCFTTNETGWTPIKGSVSGNKLTIIAQDNSCTDTISWMVVGERQDYNIINNTMTDSEGHLIVEPDFEEIVEPYNPGEFTSGSSQIGEDSVDRTFTQPLSS